MAASRASARIILTRSSSLSTIFHPHHHHIFRHSLHNCSPNSFLYTLHPFTYQSSVKDAFGDGDKPLFSCQSYGKNAAGYGDKGTDYGVRVSCSDEGLNVTRFAVGKDGKGMESFARRQGFSTQAMSAMLSSGGERTKYSLDSESLDGNGLLETIRFYGNCYWQLSKARLSMLVVSTAGAGYVMGSGAAIDWTCLGWTCFGTMMAAASANSFNQILEVKNDALMKRTMRRPLPSGRLKIENALGWAITSGVTGVGLLAFQTNSLVAGLAAANILLYTMVYTPLKQIHPLNTWVGAVVGAIPPLMGWAAATGQLNLGGWVLAAVLYFWQMPHFMALASLCSKDYEAGGYKMLSGQRAAVIALRNCLYLLPIGFVAQQLELTTGFFGWESLLLTAFMSITAAKFYFSPTGQKARQLFRASLLYLPLLMGAMLIHRLPNLQQQEEYTTLTGFGNDTNVDGILTDTEECEDRILPKFEDKKLLVSSSRPPIALISIAPFPFLPAPEYRTSFP